MGLWDDDEEIKAARPGFAKTEDLFMEPAAVGAKGRLLLIKPLSEGVGESRIIGSAGKTYAYIECDVAVLDGPVSEMLSEIPIVLEGFQFSGTSIVGTLRPRLRSGNSVLGRMGAHRPKGYNSLGWHLDEPTAADFEVARAFKAMMREKMLKADRAADPFMAPSTDTDGRPPWMTQQG